MEQNPFDFNGINILDLFDSVCKIQGQLEDLPMKTELYTEINNLERKIMENRYNLQEHIESQKEHLYTIGDTDEFINVMSETAKKQIYQKIFDKVDKLQWYSSQESYYLSFITINNVKIEIRSYIDKILILDGNYVISEYDIEDNDLYTIINKKFNSINEAEVLKALDNL